MRPPSAIALSLALVAAQVALAQQSAPPSAEQRSPETALRVLELGGGVHALLGRGGNIGLFVGSDGAVLVDTQFAEGVPALLQKIRALTDQPIRFVINTHHHGDHVGGNRALLAMAPIIAHENVRKRMLEAPGLVIERVPAQLEEATKAGDTTRMQRLTRMLEEARSVKPSEIPAPSVTYGSTLTLDVGGETVHLWHMPPAHSDGDTVVYFEKAHVLHMGDDLFFRVVPVIDVDAGGTPKGYLRMFDDILARVPADVKVIPGHGDVTDVSGMREARQYVSDIIEAAQKAKAAGRSREQFVEEVELEAYRGYGNYARRFKSNCGAAYDELP